MPVNLHKHDATFTYDLPDNERYATVYSDTTGQAVATVVRPLTIGTDRRFQIVIYTPDNGPVVRRYRFKPSDRVVTFFCRAALAPNRAKVAF